MINLSGQKVALIFNPAGEGSTYNPSTRTMTLVDSASGSIYQLGGVGFPITDDNIGSNLGCIGKQCGM